MEMTAVIEGLAVITKPCKVRVEIDSSYVKNGITQWMHQWKRCGWKTASKQPVKNKDLWLKLEAALAGNELEWHWVKGHADNDDNNRCDELAREAAFTQSCSTGTQREE